MFSIPTVTAARGIVSLRTAAGIISHTKKTVRTEKQQRRYRMEFLTTGGRSSVSGAIVTVFGCTGFLGRYIVNQFGRIGSQVVIPYRGEEKSYTHLKVMGDLGQIVPYRWDINDSDTIRTAMKYSNVVINLTGRKFDTRNFTMQQVHVEGAKRIAEVAKEFHVNRFIHVSALGASPNASSEWLRTKAEGEAAVKSVFPEATIIRPSDLWGAQDRLLLDHSSMMRFWPIYPLIYSNKRIQPIWVNDVATAIVNSLKTREAIGKTYELAGPTVFTMRELSEWIKTVLKLNPYMIEANDDVKWHLGYWLGQHRRPRYTLDSIFQKEDIVLNGNFPGVKELNVVPTEMTSPVGVGCILHFREPIRMQDITFSRLELPGEVDEQKDAPY